MESPFDAKARGHTLPKIEFQLNDGLDCFLFKIDAHVNLDAAIVHPLFHPCKEATTIRINVFAFGGIEERPNVGEVMAIVYPGKAHDMVQANGGQKLVNRNIFFSFFVVRLLVVSRYF
jgi:hypothetical protein